MALKEVPLTGEISVFELNQKDIEALQPLIRDYLREKTGQRDVSNEIGDINSYMLGDSDRYNRQRKHFVVKDSKGEMLGFASYSTPDPDIAEHFNIDKPKSEAELLDIFVSQNFQGKGIEKQLFKTVYEDAKQNGKSNLYVGSDKSSDLYDEMFDTRSGVIKKSHGKDIMTWKKEL